VIQDLPIAVQLALYPHFGQGVNLAIASLASGVIHKYRYIKSSLSSGKGEGDR
jgi:hypothetical protein